MAEPEVGALDQRARIESAANNAFEKVRSTKLEKGRRGFQKDDVNCAKTMQQRGPLLGRGEHRLELFRTKKLQRMRVEADHHSRAAALGSLPHHLAYQGAVSPVHAVEIADGQSPAAHRFGCILLPVERKSAHRAFLANGKGTP